MQTCCPCDRVCVYGWMHRYHILKHMPQKLKILAFNKVLAMVQGQDNVIEITHPIWDDVHPRVIFHVLRRLTPEGYSRHRVSMRICECNARIVSATSRRCGSCNWWVDNDPCFPRCSCVSLYVAYETSMGIHADICGRCIGKY